MSSPSWIRKLFVRTPVAPITKPRPRLGVEALEDRAVPATFGVTSTLDDGSIGTLRAAISAANSIPGEDTIIFAPDIAGGVITLSGGQLTLTDSARTTIDGGAAGMTLDANHASRIFQVAGGANVALTHLTLRNGDPNRSLDGGGGVFNSGTLTIADSTLSGNSAVFGGGVSNSGTMTITGSTLSGNSAIYGGGVLNNGTMTIADSTLVGNSTEGSDGGGVANNGTLTITGSTLSGNVGLSGGGVSNDGTLTITGSTLTGNSARSGGGVYNFRTLTITDSTLSGNSADHGGGVFNSGTATLTNALVVGNTAMAWPDMYGTYTNNSSMVGVPAGYTLGQVVQVDGSGRPLLASNGGPTQTVALPAGSPAIGIGPVAAAGATVDQRGYGRPAAGPIDLGAYQTTAVPREAAGLLVTTLVDTVNGFDGQTSLREAVAYANSHSGADTITFAPGVAGGVITLAGSQLTLTDSARMTIDGGAAGVTIDGNHASRLFQVAGGADAALTRLTLRNGAVDYGDNNGGGVLNFGSLTISNSKVTGNQSVFRGGAINNEGTLSVVNSTFSNNRSTNGDAGAIFNTGTTTVDGSTFDSNSSYGFGGAIYNGNRLTITNSTFVSNQSPSGYTHSIANSSGTTMIMKNSTVISNGTGDGVIYSRGDVTINNSIVAATDDGQPTVLLGTFTGANNLIGNPSGYSLGQVVQVDGSGRPLLASNGGPTQTVALAPHSPAIGAAQAGVTTTDQRGITRNANPDIGAFETQVPIVEVLVNSRMYNGSPFELYHAEVKSPIGRTLAGMGSPSMSYSYSTSNGVQLSGPPTSVGNYTVRAVFTSDVAGYRDAVSPTVSFSILKATTQIDLTAADATYTGSGYAGVAASLSYYQNVTLQTAAGNTLEGVGLMWEYTLPGGITSSTPPVNVGSYTARAIFPGSANYAACTSPSVQVSITPATLTVAADADTNTAVQDVFSRTYGDADPTLTYRVTGLVGSDTAAGVLTGALARMGGTDAGSYTVTQGSLASGSSNYTVSFSPVAFTITPRVLTVAAAAADRVYDGTTTANASLTFGNAIAGESPTATFTAAFRDKNAGANKPIDVTGLALAPAFAGNYTLAGVTGVTTAASINQKAITSGFTVVSRVYDGTSTATVVSRTLGGVVNGDDVGLTGGTAVFADKNAGANKPVTLSGATLTGADASNYTLIEVNPAAATISPRALTATASAANKVYDGTTTATVSLTDNRLSGDQLTLGYASAMFDTATVGTYKPVTINGITVTGMDSGNYTVNSTATATASITPAFATVTLTTDRPVAVPGLAVTFTATVAAVGGGTVTGTVTFRDGATVLGTAAVVNGVARLTTDAFQYGSHTVTATYAGPLVGPVTPPSLGVSVVPAAVLADPVTGQNALFVGGTAGADEIEVKREGNDRYEVEIGAGCHGYEQAFTGPLGRIVVYAGAGNDEVEFNGNVRIPVWVFGGDGNDDISGGENAQNVILGGAGNDELRGGTGRDILIGGAGADDIDGKGGDDLLISGWTAFDLNESALWGVQVEWLSDRTYEQRVANLRGTGSGPRSNGNVFLKASGSDKTVFDDGSRDVLKGGSGRDWYIANRVGGVIDQFDGLASNEWVDELS